MRQTGAVYHGNLQRAVTTGVGLGFALLVLLAFTRNVNWDEFYFLSHVHAFLEGRLDRPLQTFFVRGFTWLAQVPGHEMEQILFARLVMVGCLAITAWSIHHISKHVTDIASANIAVLAFLASGFVLPHGASFRADPIAAALITTAMTLILTTNMKLMQVLTVSVLGGLAVLVTIKSFLFAPAFLGAVIWRWHDKGVVLRILLSGVLSLCVFAGLYVWHANGIDVASGNDTATNARDAAVTGLLQSGLFPRAPYITLWAILTAVPLVLALIGLTVQRSLKSAIVLLLLASPLLSVVIYRNAYPYFFPFATPLMMVAVAFGAQALKQSPWLPRSIFVMLLIGAAQAFFSFADGTAAQRATIAEVHRLFPEPVPYIDDSSMIASFPSVGPFLSSWGVSNYQKAGRPVYGSLLAEDEPPLLIANKTTLISVMNGPDSGLLLAQDMQALLATYVHYNGAIWLAGKELALTQTEHQLTIPFAGQYRVEVTAPIRINGNWVDDGDIVALADKALIEGVPATRLKLIWDTGVLPLKTELPAEGLYAGFWMLQR